jgi:hypothetical protein
MEATATAATAAAAASGYTAAGRVQPHLVVLPLLLLGCCWGAAAVGNLRQHCTSSSSSADQHFLFACDAAQAQLNLLLCFVILAAFLSMFCSCRRRTSSTPATSPWTTSSRSLA